MPTDTSGSNLGNKLKGVVEVVHGAGENLRGAFMGALDTLTKDESTPHDNIVRQGKLEMERGFAHLRSSKEKEGSFAIGSTAPPASYKHNNAGTGGIEQVPDANIPGPETYETGMGRGIVPNIGDHTTSTNPEKLETIQHQGDAISGLRTQELHNNQDEHSVPLSKSNVQELRSEYDPSHAPYRKQTVDFTHPEGSSNTKAVPEDRKDGTKEGSTTGPAVNPPSPGLVN